MKYLEPSFSIAVSNPKPKSADDLREDIVRRARAKRPHEYVNGGGMCQLCGLDRLAALHDNQYC